MNKSFIDKLKDQCLFMFEKSTTVAFVKSSKGREYRDMLFAVAGNTPIPPDVWDSMSDRLKETLVSAQKSGAKISYHPDCPSIVGIFSSLARIYDKVTITSIRDGAVFTTSYNVKNSIMTYASSNSGPLCGGGMLFDPETGKVTFSFVN